MDITNIVLKYKKNEEGTQCIAYCDEYPQIKGTGPTEQHATNNFWRAFNSMQAREEQAASQKRKAAIAEADSKKKKKAS